jgi:hypothetical protein
MKIFWTILAVVFATQAVTRAEDEASTVKGVNPADNLTKFELLPKYAVLDDDSDTSIFTTTLKYDRAIQGIYGVNMELPVGSFDSPYRDDVGVGDLNLRGRVQFRAERWTFITGLEAVLPVASEDTLGSGKYQLNPVAVAVYPFSASTFAAFAAKQLFSVAGDSDRADIVQGQYRVILAHTTSTGGWYLFDPQLWVNYDDGGATHFAPEVEVGQMVGRQTGIWLRGGGHVAGDWDKEDWNISGGVRFIAF